ncbi:MAG TPA: SBBP repeat-containing protein [Planctomycetota bacterium]|nr:SBBP repeat-containing protein [Planctomycetota bacterium]
MKCHGMPWLSAILGISIVCAMSVAAAPLDRDQGDAAKSGALELFSATPAVFIENTGQIADPAVRYAFYGDGANVFHTTSGPVFQVLQRGGHGVRPGAGALRPYTFSATFPGARQIEPIGRQLLETKVNYCLGSDHGKWQMGVPTFRVVVYEGLYDGVDLHTFGRRSGMKYEFRVHPGADWTRIRVRYEGIDSLRLDADGAMHVMTPLGELTDDAPFVYQMINGRQVPIPARFRLIDAVTWGFDLAGEPDPAHWLVFDPDLAWESVIDGSGVDRCTAIDVDASGNIYVAGTTESADFPAHDGYDTTYNYWGDAFVVKLSPAGDVIWATFLGGSNSDSATGIAVSPSGSVVVSGTTKSRDFPVPFGFDTTHGGGFPAGTDAFVARFTASGGLEWATYLGGTGDDNGGDVACDCWGNVIVVGATSSPNFPVAGGFDTSYNGDLDGFILRISPSGHLLWSSYIGGSGNDNAIAVAIDPACEIVLAGYTESSDLPVPGGFDTELSYEDVFVAKVAPSGQLLWASYFGGRSTDYPFDIAVDAEGNAYITGSTHSPDLPTPGGYDQTYGGSKDCFVAKITNDVRLEWSSYLGGIYADEAAGITIGPAGDIFIAGYTESPGFPAPGGFYPASDSWHHGFLTRISPACEVLWGTFLEGSGCVGVHADTDGNVIVCSNTGYVAVIRKIRFARSLTVQSTPFSVPITGDVPGTAGYTVSLPDDAVVNLTAPQATAAGLVRYRLVRWVVDGVNRPAGVATVQVTMASDHTLMAVYEILTHFLSVQSTPVAGIAITGDAPGTTAYTAICNDQQAVTIAAPERVVVGSVLYDFLRWAVDGLPEPEGQTALQLIMVDARSAVAIYRELTPELIIRGPCERGEPPLPSGGGTFTVDVLLRNVYELAGLQAALLFPDEAGTDAGFPISTNGGNPLFGGLCIQFNTILLPHAYPFSLGDGRTFGFMPKSGEVDIIDEARIFSVTFDYGQSSAGTYAIVTDPIITSLGGSTGGILFHETAGSLQIARQWNLSVDSLPIPYVPIAGTMSGVTPCTFVCDDGQDITLQVPERLTIGSLEYGFARWTLDGVDQPRREATLHVTMNEAHSAIAVLVLFGDVNDDCRVDVLDMILIRNRLTGESATPGCLDADLNGDGRINVLDLLLVRARLGAKCP